MSASVKVVGIEQVILKATEYTEEKKSAIKKIVADSGLLIQGIAMKRVPVDTGHLRRSISAEVTDEGYGAEIKANTNYAIFVEFGTSPHFPPPNELTGWAKRHGMRGKEFLIARAISKKGTPAQPFLFPAFEQERNKFIGKLKTEMAKP